MTCASCQESITDRAMKAKDQVSDFKEDFRQLATSPNIFSVNTIYLYIFSTITSITLSAVAAREVCKMCLSTPSKTFFLHINAFLGYAFLNLHQVGLFWIYLDMTRLQTKNDTPVAKYVTLDTKISIVGCGFIMPVTNSTSFCILGS